jgi:hypothetical protein
MTVKATERQRDRRKIVLFEYDEVAAAVERRIV